MASLLGAVTPREAPQTGVKRPLLGTNPTAVPNNQPAFRGRPVSTPEQEVKVPRLSQGNRPNQGTNVAVPYSRICPLEFLSGWTGRLAPGDVAFVVKHPPGFLSKQPLGSGTNGPATMSRVIGLDGVNRLLHGAHCDEGWAVGHNMLVVDANSSPMQVLSNQTLGGFTLSALDALRLDGVVKSNDEPYASTSNGARDAVVFNNVVQGVTIVNNGYLLYEPNPNPTDAVANAVPGGAQSRGVEAHARGTVEGGYHVGGPGGGRPPANRPGEWLRGRYDFVSTFTGTHTELPTQMFDRAITPMSTLYIGLRAYAMTDVNVLTKQLRKDADSEPGSWFDAQPEVVDAVQALGPNPSAADVAKAKKAVQTAVLTKNSFYFFQCFPFSSRAAHLCQHVRDGEYAIRSDPNDSDTTKARKLVEFRARINGMLPSHQRGEERSMFDRDIFDAVRTVDLLHMVGAWTVGRVLDVAAMRHTSYHGGPSDTSFALTVDVQVSWRAAFYGLGGSVATDVTRTDKDGKKITTKKTAEENAADNQRLVEYGTNDVDRNGKLKWDKDDATDPRRAAERLRKDELAVDAFNAQFPSMQQAVGVLFGTALGSGGLTATGITSEAALEAVEEALAAVEGASTPEEERVTLAQLTAALPLLQRQSSKMDNAEKRQEARLKIQRAARALQERRAAQRAAAAKAAAEREQVALKTTLVVTTAPAAKALYARELQQNRLGASAMERVRELVDALDPDLPDSEKRVARPYPEGLGEAVNAAVFAAEYVSETRTLLATFDKALGSASAPIKADRRKALEGQLATVKAYAAMAAIDAAKGEQFRAARAKYQEALDAELALIRSRLNQTVPRADSSVVANVGRDIREWTQGATGLIQRYVKGAQASDSTTEQVYRLLLGNAQLRFQALADFANIFNSAMAIRYASVAQEARDPSVRDEARSVQRGWLTEAEQRVLSSETVDSPVHQALMQRILMEAFVNSSDMHELHDHAHQLTMAHLEASGHWPHGLVLPDDANPAPSAAAAAVTDAAVAATAPVVAAALAKRQRAKTPVRDRGASTGAAATSASAAGPSTSAATGASTSAGAPAPPPRPRARPAEGETSVVSSVFNDIFGTSDDTSAAMEAPASPTPSSGSDHSAGPRTFKRTQGKKQP